MSEKLILELYERIIVLEEKVKKLETSSSIQEGFEPEKKREQRNLGKYRYLADYLLESNKKEIDLTFTQIEDIIKSKLPLSARRYRALWANSESHSIAVAWMSVGYRLTEIDMEKEIVRFERR